MILFSNVRIPASLKIENRLDGVDLNSNRCECGVRKSRGKIVWVSADNVNFGLLWRLWMNNIFHFFQKLFS